MGKNTERAHVARSCDVARCAPAREAPHRLDERSPRRPPADPDFEQQVLAHWEGLTVQARYLCRSRTESEDLIQEVVLKALQYRHQFERGTNLRAWLRTIMRNTFLLRQRGRSRESDVDPESAQRRLAHLDDPTMAMQLDEVRRALCLLPKPYRDALTLAAAGSSYDEMSYILGCAVGTVKSRLSRARDLLQAVLQEGEFKALPCSSNPAAKLEADFISLAGRSPAGQAHEFH